MSEEFGPTFITLTDEDGNEIELEHLHTLEWNGVQYMAFLPAESEEDGEEDEAFGLIILKVTDEDGEAFLSTLEDESELEAVYEQLIEVLDEDEDED